jgi:hypothetical protein
MQSLLLTSLYSGERGRSLKVTAKALTDVNFITLSELAL